MGPRGGGQRGEEHEVKGGMVAGEHEAEGSVTGCAHFLFGEQSRKRWRSKRIASFTMRRRASTLRESLPGGAGGGPRSACS